MWGKVKKSFIPFFVLLVVLLFTTVYLDNEAVARSRMPKVIQVTALANEDSLFFEELNNDWLSEDSTFMEAKLAYETGKYKQAIRLFEQLQITHPTQSEVYKYLGSIYFKKGSYALSKSYYETSLGFNREDELVWCNLGLVNSKLGIANRALSCYQEAIKIHGNRPKPFLNAGILLIDKRDYEKAVESLENAISLSSGKLKSKAYYYKGLAHKEAKNLKLAEEAFFKSIEYNPKHILSRVQLASLSENPSEKILELQKVMRLKSNYAPVYYELALAYDELEDLEQKEVNLKLAVEYDSQNELYLKELGDFYLSQDRIDEASALLVNRERTDTLNADYFFYKGKLAAKRNNLEEAVNYYQKAIQKAEGSHAEACLNLGIVYKQLGKNSLAAKSYQEALSIKNSYQEAYFNMAILQNDAGNKRLALNYYDSTLMIAPDYPKAWYNKGMLLKKDDETAAIVCFKNALKHDPKMIKAALNLGVTYASMDQYETAIQYYDNILMSKPNYVKARYNKAVAFNNIGQYSEAKDELLNLLQIRPDHKGAKRLLINVLDRSGDQQEMIARFEEYVSDYENDIKARKELAAIYMDQKMIQKGGDHFTKVLQMDPKQHDVFQLLKGYFGEDSPQVSWLNVQGVYFEANPDAESMYQLGRSYHRKNHFEQAINWYSKSIETGQNNDWVYYWRGKAFEEKGNRVQAKENYLKALSLDEKHKYALYRLTIVLSEMGENELSQKYTNDLKQYHPEFANEKNLTL